MKYPAIICDLDGTLSDATHRRHFVEKNPKDFKKFYGNLGKDEPNGWCKVILEFQPIEVNIILVSGRPSNYRTATKRWLKKWGIEYAHLFMRKTGDYRPDFEVKQEIYDKKIRDNYEVLFCIDDRKQVVEMWRKNGLVCLQCDDGDF